MFLTLRGLMLTEAYKHGYCGTMTSAAYISGLPHVIFSA